MSEYVMPKPPEGARSKGRQIDVNGLVGARLGKGVVGRG